MTNEKECDFCEKAGRVSFRDSQGATINMCGEHFEGIDEYYEGVEAE
ncbi:hypothetical protein [Peribacillus butanolivorans]|nr:hypothetical protein [Peribacillus butanolivorans]